MYDKNYEYIIKYYLSLNFYQSHSPKGNQTDQFLSDTSKYLCLKGYDFI